jgi:hypothetical protein
MQNAECGMQKAQGNGKGGMQITELAKEILGSEAMRNGQWAKRE